MAFDDDITCPLQSAEEKGRHFCWFGFKWWRNDPVCWQPMITEGSWIFECNYSNHQTLKKKKRRVGKHEGDKAAQKKAGNKQKQRCKQMTHSRKREGCKDVKVWRNKKRLIFPSRTWSLRSAAAWSWHTQSCRNSRCHKPERRHERSECLDSKHLTIPA